MHPPFGFALFYLRSVSPKERYRYKVTGRLMAAVTTGQIYRGAIPFVIIQVVMVGLAIGLPGMVLHYKGKPEDPSSIEFTIPPICVPGTGQAAPPSFALGQ